MKFIVYDPEGEILRQGTAPATMISIQAGEDEYAMEGSGDPSTHKVIDGRIVPKDAFEKKTFILSQMEIVFPVITVDMSDVDISQVVGEHFLNTKNVSAWRVDNYSALRKVFYPDGNEVFDANAKMTSKDPIIVNEGKAQLAKYYADVLAVKKRFPKQ